MYKLVLIRHGESTWNLENRFTGWTDVDLTDTGVQQAQQAGKLLRENGYEFDLAYTSVLKRAIHTLWHCLDAMDCQWLPAAATIRRRRPWLPTIRAANAMTAATPASRYR